MMNEYQKQAQDFLREANATMKIKYVGDVNGFPFEEGDTRPHRKYSVTISRNGDSYRFPFYGSTADWENKRDPTEYDVLACLEKYEVQDMADFVEEFGYTIVDRKSFQRVEKIWKGVKNEYESLFRLFGEELMEKLAEIN